MNQRLQALKRFLKKTTVPFVAGGAIVVLFQILLDKIEPDYKAPKEVKRFRKFLAFRKGEGLFYELQDFQDFIANYRSLTPFVYNKDNKPDTLKTYRWVIGFYWKITNDENDNDKAKHGFCMIPTLVNNSSKEVMDYYEDKGKDEKDRLYNHDLDGEYYSKKFMDPPTNAFDNGQLWP